MRLVVSLLLAWGGAMSGMAQEVPLSLFPVAMRQPIPDAVMYRMLLEHAAAFHRRIAGLERWCSATALPTPVRFR